MKSLLEFKSIVEEEKSDYSKFDTLVRAGLANKAQMQRIHKILDKMGEDRPQFNNADRMIIQNLFNKMVDLISNNKAINMQARRAVKEDEDFIETDQLDEAQNPGPTPPYVLLLKRKAIRLYPDGTKIALYYNKQLKKYFSVPYDTPVASAIQAEEIVSEMNIGKKKPKSDTHHIVDKEGKTLSLASYLDKASAVKDLEKHPGGKVVTLGPRGKVKEEVELEEAHDPWKDKQFGPTKIIKQKYHVKTDTKSYNVKADNEDHAHKLVTNHAPGSKIVSIEHKGRIMEETIDEAVMDQLHKIVNDKQAQSVKFASGHTRKIDHFTASALTQVHKALNDDNKKKFADLVHKSPEHFMKASDFAFKHAK